MNAEPSRNGVHEQIGFLRGLNYGLGDCGDFEKALGTKLWIPDIALYDGELPKGADRRQEEDRIAARIGEEAMMNNCTKFIAHSRGTFMALLAAQQAIQQHHKVSSLVMIPAAGDPETVPVKDDADSLEDAVLYSLCRTMRPELYAALKQRHAPTLKKTLKVMNPKKYAVPVADVREKILGLDQHVPILIIDCEHDPFRDLDRLHAMMGGRTNMAVSDPLPCGHFPHIECPELLAETIRDWERSITIQHARQPALAE